MLTDIFSYRYAARPIWNEFRETDRALLVQGFQLVSEQLFPLSKDIPPNLTNKNAWLSLHSRLTRELGMESLSPLRWGFENSKHAEDWGPRSPTQVCKTWLLEEYKPTDNADKFMKERISFLELAFRDHKQLIVAAEMNHKSRLELLNKKTVDPKNNLILLMEAFNNPISVELDMLKIEIAIKNSGFISACDELNVRFQRAKVPLNYHNGFIQIETDTLVQEQITEPFWKLINDPKWRNVEIDMMEAVDRREANDRDPAVYASRALESVIKIISDTKGWTTGKETGAGHYLTHLRTKAKGPFVAEWEADAIQLIFSKVRNGLSHGPGSEPMPVLTQQQTDWTIEAAMSWIKSLIGRLESERMKNMLT